MIMNMELRTVTKTYIHIYKVLYKIKILKIEKPQKYRIFFPP